MINNQYTSFEQATQNQGFLIQAEALQSLLIKDTTHTLRNRYYLLMVILTLIELSALLSKLILDTKSYSSKVEFYIQKELQETAIDKEITTAKQEAYKKAALEKETKLIEEFFTKTESTKAEKLDKIVDDWAAKNGQTYKDAWDIVNKDLMVHHNR